MDAVESNLTLVGIVAIVFIVVELLQVVIACYLSKEAKGVLA